MRTSSNSPRRSGSPRLPWLGVLVVVVALLATAISIVANVGQGPRPSFLGDTASVEPSTRLSDGRLHVAGSGSCVPLARMLAGAMTGQGRPAPQVHASIGSGGGLRALGDGAIDVALVSRPLRPEERERGLVYSPFALVPVVVATHLDVPETDITAERLAEIYGRARTTWNDGSRIHVLQRERGDSSHRVIAEVLGGFRAVDDTARADHAFRIIYHDAAMQVALANTSGAIGLHGNGVDPALAGFRALSVDGVEPSVENVASGRYPFVKELAFVTQGEATADAAEFLEFARSAAGRELLRKRGAVPLPREEAE